jgi:8-oxoguanine deaminase
MGTLLIRHATVLVTMDAQRREIADGGLFVRDGFIEQVGRMSELPSTADEIRDLSGHLVLPGLVNTHHHLYQTLTRAVPAVQNADLFHWLVTLYPIWANLTPEALRISTLTGLAELALSGCTTVSDHLYMFPNGCRLDDEIEAAREIGMRFHAARGSMSLGESKGGLPPDHMVEEEAFILKDSLRLIEQYHDPKPGALTRIVLAPCSPFSVTPEMMRQSPGGSYGDAGLGRQRCMVRALGSRQRRRDRAVRAHRLRRRPLPLIQHAARVRHCSCPKISRRGCEGRFGCGWLCQQ